MQYIADRCLNRRETAGAPSSIFALLLGILSVILYVLLYLHSDELVEMAQTTRQGDKDLFPVPLVLAFVFSLVHGTFTGHFWDLLGLKPRT